MINLVIDILKANTTLTNLVDANNIYPLIQLQGGTIPSVVVQLTNTDPNDTQDKVSTYDNNSVEVTCMAISPAAAWGISEAVRAALDGYTGGLIAQVRFVTQATDIFESTEVFSVTQGYSVHLKRDGGTLPIAIAGLGEFYLNDIADVDTTGVTDGQVLTYDAATNSWLAEDGSVVAALGDLTDVTIGTPANNQVLLYNEAGPYWQNSLLSLQQLSNVTNELGDALDRQALVYDEATNQWIHDGVGQVVIPVRNPSRDDSIAVGTVLKATGAQGDRILVAPFNVGDDPKLLVGIASEPLGATNDTKDGHAQVYGELRNIDTQLHAVGTVLYAGDGGALSTTVSEHPIAIVTRQHESTGRIFIRTWIPGRSRYNSEVETLRAEMEASLANADVELMFSAQADGFGVAYSPESDSVVNSTPPEDYQVERAIFYNNTGLASYVSDSGWSTLTTNTESYAAAKARVEDYIRGGTYGKLPCTFAIVRTEELKFEGLLDLYPGAAAAYSLRLLDKDYTGAAIRVRRATDSAEQDIGFDGNGDLDTTSLATFCSGTDGFVKTWYDQSGNANDATQTTTTRQPKIYDSSAGVITKNGKPILQSYANVDFPTINYTGVTTQSVYAVGQIDTSSAALGQFNNSTFLAASSGGAGGIGLTATFYKNGTSYAPANQGAVYTDLYQTQSLIAANFNGSSYTSFSVSYPLLTAYNMFSLNEWLMFDNQDNRSAIETNINTYYSIYP